MNTAEAELGYAGNIYINYQTTAEEVWWTEGNFRYSNIYQRETYTRILMPEGQVAVSLNLNNTETVTDTVGYFRQGNNYYKDSNHTQLVGSRTYHQSFGGGYYTYNFNGDDDGDSAGTTATFTYLGEHTSGFSSHTGSNFFTRQHQVANNTSTTLTIPATVTAPADKLGGGV